MYRVRLAEIQIFFFFQFSEGVCSFEAMKVSHRSSVQVKSFLVMLCLTGCIKALVHFFLFFFKQMNSNIFSPCSLFFQSGRFRTIATRLKCLVINSPFAPEKKAQIHNLQIFSEKISPPNTKKKHLHLLNLLASNGSLIFEFSYYTFSKVIPFPTVMFSIEAKPKGL